MSYFSNVINPVTASKTLKRLVFAIKNSNASFDFIAVRGISGALVGSYLTVKLGKPVVVIRKEHDDSHGTSIERDDDLVLYASHYIIVDDGISSGRTLREIINQLHTEFCAQIVGVFTYCQSDVASSSLFDSEKINSIFNDVKELVFNVFICNCECKKTYWYGIRKSLSKRKPVKVL